MLRDLGYTALLLGVLIFVHELGHFLVAKLLKVKVVRFSLGFGPKLLAFTKGETEYQLAVIPLGGYVKMAGEMPGDEGVSEEDAARGFLAQPPWKRALIVAAGPVFSLAFPVLVYFFVFFGSHQAASSRIGTVIAGLPAEKADLRAGDLIVAIDGTPIRTFEEIPEALGPKYDQDVLITVERDGQRFNTTLRPARNVTSDILETAPRGVIGIDHYPQAPVLGIPNGSIAQQAGLKTFDRVVRVNGTPVDTEYDFFQALAKAEGPTVKLDVVRSEPLDVPAGQLLAPSVVSVEVAKQPGDRYAVIGAESSALYVGTVVPGSAAEAAGLRRGDRLLTLDGKPLESWTMFGLALKERQDKPFELAWRSGDEVKSQTVKQAPMGARDEVGTKVESLDFGLRSWTTRFEERSPDLVTLHMGAGEAIAASLKRVPEVTLKTAMAIGAMITGRVSMDNMGSVLMIHDLAAKSAQVGADAYLELMAVISINLGIVNLLPIPILDGFALLAALWEAVRRRPIPVRAREIANLVGLAMLLFLMGIAIKNDIVRMW